MYVWVQMAAKLSVLLLYYRLFNLGGATWFQWAIKIGVAWKIIVGLIYTFMIIFGCSPISASWDSSVPNAKCLDSGLMIFSGAIISIFEDVTLVVLPIPALSKLNVSGRKRWGVSIMFASASL
jgi:energy-converting hydrogenase Eha subunit A